MMIYDGASYQADGLFFIVFAILGACLGSFTTALLYRVPRGISWIYDRSDERKHQKAETDSINKKSRSFCPSCRHTLHTVDLIPILSWILCAGRCRYCKASISPRYPLVEVSMVIAALAVYSVVSDVIPAFLLCLSMPFLTTLIGCYQINKVISYQMLGASIFMISAALIVLFHN